MIRLLPLGLLAASLAGCTQAGSDSDWPTAPGPKVVVSFAPIHCFVANVAGPDAAVRPLMTSQGPHHFEPGQREAKLLTGADLFFINGLNLDNKKADRLAAGAPNKKLRVIDLGGRLDKKLLLEGACNHDHSGDGHQHDHEHGIDPHVWLGIEPAEKMVESIRHELRAADPAHTADYDRRAGEYIAKLRKLKADGLEMLKDKTDRTVLPFHGSLGYLAQTFDLTMAEPIQDVPGQEPSAKQLDAIVRSCVKNKVRVIAVEPQYSTKTSAAAVLKALHEKGLTDAVLIEIDPLETCPESEFNPDWYEAKMRANLAALAKALK